MKTIPLQQTDQNLVDLFRALGHPARLRILRLLTERKACICGEIVEELPLAQATVSQHLKVLKQAGLITGQVEGPAVCYCLAPGALSSLLRTVAQLATEAGEGTDCCSEVLYDSHEATVLKVKSNDRRPSESGHARASHA